MTRPKKRLPQNRRCLIDFLALQRARQELGLTAYEASKLCGVVQGTFSRWEMGDLVPTRRQAERIIEQFGFEPSELVI